MDSTFLQLPVPDSHQKKRWPDAKIGLILSAGKVLLTATSEISAGERLAAEAAEEICRLTVERLSV